MKYFIFKLLPIKLKLKINTIKKLIDLIMKSYHLAWVTRCFLSTNSLNDSVTRTSRGVNNSLFRPEP